MVYSTYVVIVFLVERLSEQGECGGATKFLSLPTAVLAIFDFLPFFIQTDETCDLNFISNMIRNRHQ